MLSGCVCPSNFICIWHACDGATASRGQGPQATEVYLGCLKEMEISLRKGQHGGCANFLDMDSLCKGSPVYVPRGT